MPIQKAPGLVAYAFSRCNYTTSETPRSETSARIEAVAVKMRPTGLGHGVYKDVPDYSIFCGERCVGRIYETAADPRAKWY